MKKSGGSVKFTISLPREEADYVERVRKMSGASRSSVIRDALSATLKAERRAERNRLDEEGYRKMPVTEEERTVSEAFLKAWAEGQEKEDW